MELVFDPMREALWPPPRCPLRITVPVPKGSVSQASGREARGGAGRTKVHLSFPSAQCYPLGDALAAEEYRS
jgi:hypothetical protein